MPSPYQRDVFRALRRLDQVELKVFYLEANAPDSPWDDVGLEAWESVLPGWCLGRGRVRSHLNWRIPDLTNADYVVVNTALTDVTTQMLLRQQQRLAPNAWWLFWGELIRTGGGTAGWLRSLLAAPLAKLDGIVAIGKRAETAYRNRFRNQRVFNLPYHCELHPFIDAASASRNVPAKRQPQERPSRLSLHERGGHSHLDSQRLTRADEPKADLAVADETPSACHFLFCGQMIHRKGIDVLLTAFDRLVRDNPSVVLGMVGREADVTDHISTLPEAVSSRIQLHGFRQIDELPEYFARADVFVLPSRHDGWGVVINQAMAAGLPIISTDQVGAADDLIEDGKNGFIVSAGQMEPLFQAMKKLCDNSTLRADMSAANSRLAPSLTPDSAARKWLSITQQLAE